MTSEQANDAFQTLSAAEKAANKICDAVISKQRDCHIMPDKVITAENIHFSPLSLGRTHSQSGQHRTFSRLVWVNNARRDVDDAQVCTHAQARTHTHAHTHTHTHTHTHEYTSACLGTMDGWMDGWMQERTLGRESGSNDDN